MPPYCLKLLGRTRLLVCSLSPSRSALHKLFEKTRALTKQRFEALSQMTYVLIPIDADPDDSLLRGSVLYRSVLSNPTDSGAARPFSAGRAANDCLSYGS